MATSDFLPFGTGAGASVLSQADYAALAARLAGFSAGVAKSVELNKVWRQSSIMSAVLAQLIVDLSGQNAVDDGNTAALLANLKAALAGRLLRTTVITSTSTFTPHPLANGTEVEGSSGGGGGGGAAATTGTTTSLGSGGNAGSYARIRIAGAIPGTVSVVVGGGGAVNVGAAGSQGGASSFGTYLILPGGPGGLASVASPPPYFGSGNSNSAAPTVTGATTILALPGISGGGGYGMGNTLASTAPGRGTANQLGGAGAPPVGWGTGGNGAGNGPSSAASPGASFGTAGGFLVREYA